MKPRSIFAFTLLACAAFDVIAGPYPQAPFYSYPPPATLPTTNFMSVTGTINLATVPPATNAAQADQEFNARAAAAIYQAAVNGTLPTNNLDNGEGWQSKLLAMWAFQDFFTNDPQGDFRAATYVSILNHQVGQEGTDTSSGSQDEYDFTLNFYIPLVYRYYGNMPLPLSDYLITNLMSQSTLSGVPSGRSGVGPTGDVWSEFIHIPDIVDISETENHLLGIETARYLVNQLLYQRTQNPMYDNMRNGDSEGSPNTTDWILDALQGFLKDDFLEYNARPYQDFDMSALLNLATYAYDDRVRIGARMVLDYLSAKEAVSSSDLRRAPPFRRRNELQHYGPTIDGNFLGAPLVYYFCCVEGTTNENYEHDPQIAYYSLLAGNTQVFFPTSPPANPAGPGNLPGYYNWEMVHAALTDYRVPDPILDLFANPIDRRFYQYLRHYAYNNEYASELYAGSPSYLISAGGNATTYCYQANVQAPAQAIIDALSVALDGVPGFIIESIVQGAVSGETPDLGAAVPTFFMPTGQGTTLSDMIQFGQYTTDESQLHMGVAPDFACGDTMYVPPAIQSDPGNVVVGPWTFVNRGGAPGQPGYYLAIYTTGDGPGFLEAYDTMARPDGSPPVTFDEFRAGVLTLNPNVSLQYEFDQVNSYTTQAGQTIQFTLSPDAEIVATTEMSPAPSADNAFADGSILKSQQGTGLVTISNPATQQTITLDMRDAFHPTRTSETGRVDYAGEEVWVNFNYGANAGDFAQPYTSLANATAALNRPNPATTFKIVSGAEHESVTISKPVTLMAVGGPVTIYGQ